MKGMGRDSFLLSHPQEEEQEQEEMVREEKEKTKKLRESSIRNVFCVLHKFQVSLSLSLCRRLPFPRLLIPFPSLCLLACPSVDDAIHSRLSHTGFTSQFIDHLLPYLNLSSSCPSSHPSSPPSSHPSHPTSSSSKSHQLPSSSSPASGKSQQSHPSVANEKGGKGISMTHLSSHEFDYLLRELSLEFSLEEKRVVTRRCHENFRGTNFNEINLIKLFHDRMRMRKKLLQRQRQQQQRQEQQVCQDLLLLPSPQEKVEAEAEVRARDTKNEEEPEGEGERESEEEGRGS
jgi:hypothetical protein